MKANKKKVLVVDDDDIHLYTTRELLQEEQCDVITHKNAFGVTNLVNITQPDLVLLDINMPGLAGDSLAALLRSNDRTRDTKIIFYSSNDESTLQQSVLRHGVTDYICKGNIADLKKKVRRHLLLD